jgi:hypothetical protein
MFQMAADGVTAIQIAKTLSREKVLTPRAYMHERTGKYANHFNTEFPTDWGKTTVVSILRNREYLGHLVSHKRGSKSFKNKKQIDKPESDWIIVENTHVPLIDEPTFEKVQRFLTVKHRANACSKENLFAGLLKCATCGVNLGFAGRNGKNGAYVCNRYRKQRTHCTSHYISHDALKKLVLADIRKHAEIAKLHEHDIAKYIAQLAAERTKAGNASAQQELERGKARSAELDRIIKKLFEQNALGTVSDERFAALSREYESEQRDLKRKVEGLQDMISRQKSKTEDAGQFYGLLRKYTDVTELSKTILNDLIDHIVVHNAVGRYKERKQKVDIYYRFVGFDGDEGTCSL